MIALTLPISPSANRYWRIMRGRAVESPEAKAYKRSVGLLCRAAGIKPYSGPVSLGVTVFRARKAGDLDNFLKVAQDALKGWAFFDDKQVRQLVAVLEDDKDNPRLEVSIIPLEVDPHADA